MGKMKIKWQVAKKAAMLNELATYCTDSRGLVNYVERNKSIQTIIVKTIR